MADDVEAGFREESFSGDGGDGLAAYKVRRRWARKAIMAQKTNGTLAEIIGPWLYTLLDCQAALAVEDVAAK